MPGTGALEVCHCSGFDTKQGHNSVQNNVNKSYRIPAARLPNKTRVLIHCIANYSRPYFTETLQVKVLELHLYLS